MIVIECMYNYKYMITVQKNFINISFAIYKYTYNSVKTEKNSDTYAVLGGKFKNPTPNRSI